MQAQCWAPPRGMLAQVAEDGGLARRGACHSLTFAPLSAAGPFSCRPVPCEGVRGEWLQGTPDVAAQLLAQLRLCSIAKA